MTHHWTLAVDESGSFRGADETCVVSGLLLRRACGRRTHELREAIRRALPHAPYPIHTTTLAHPVAQVMWHRLATPQTQWDRLDGARAERAERAWALLERHAPHTCALAASGVRGVEQRSLLDDARDALHQHDRALATALRNAATADLTRWRGLIRALVGDDHAAWMLAAEAWPGEPAAGGEDPYLALLGSLIERTAHALLQRPGEHEVRLVVLSRDVERPPSLLGDAARTSARRRPLHTRDVAAAATRALGALSVHTAAASVRLVPYTTPSWDEALPPAPVIADLLANTAWRVLRRSTGGLDQLEQRLSLIDLPLRTAEHPHINAGAQVRRWNHTRAHTPAPHAPLAQDDPPPARWAIEQADRWLPWLTTFAGAHHV